MAKKPRENRVPIMLSDVELQKIDDWRYSKRVATRSEAIRRLCQVGLFFNEHDHELKETVAATLKFVIYSDLANGSKSAKIDGENITISKQLFFDIFQTLERNLDLTRQFIKFFYVMDGAAYSENMEEQFEFMDAITSVLDELKAKP